MSIECNPDDNKLDTDSDTETNTNNPMELDNWEEQDGEYVKFYELDTKLDITIQLANINLVSNNDQQNQMKTD